MTRFSRFRRSYERRRDDERGATLIIVGICATLFIWAGAFSIDLGIETVGNRQLQAVADAGALDAARYIDVTSPTPPSLTQVAQNAAADNGDSGATTTATLGYWTGTQFETQAAHCSQTTPSALPICNAVSVTATQPVPELFHGGNAALSRTSIAAINLPGGLGGAGDATFGIGSYLASYNTQQTAVLNVLLGSLGTSANLTAVGYGGLASTNVTLLQLIGASAGTLTASNVLTTSLTGAQWVTLFDNVTGSTYLGSSFLGSTITGGTSASLCQLVSVNGSTCANGVLAPYALSASINVLQTLITEAELANGSSALNVTSALSLPNVVSSSLYISLTQVAQIRTGGVGTVATTSQVSVDLKLTLGLGLGVLDIPISGATGTGTLTAVKCTNNSWTQVQINANTTAASGTVTVLGSTLATVSVSGASLTLLTYIPANVPPTASTLSADTNPVTVGTTSPSISFGTVNNGILSLAQELVVDPLLSTLTSSLGYVLQPLGVAVAGAEVSTYAASCTNAQLVS
jgi:uncharacterized membrane protein